MERYVLAFELRHLTGRCSHSATYDVSGTEACQPLSVQSDEHRQVLVATDAALL